jgi:hypothetical protein
MRFGSAGMRRDHVPHGSPFPVNSQNYSGVPNVRWVTIAVTIYGHVPRIGHLPAPPARQNEVQ